MAAAPAFSVISKPIPRVEGRDKIMGLAEYSADVKLTGTLWGKNVRSTVPHARIVRIDTSRAKAIPGVRAIITAADIPPKRIGRSVQDYEVLCSERVRFIGDPIAAVAADTQEAAEEAALAVEVEYEALPAVYDMFVAADPTSPAIHPDLFSYTGLAENVTPDLHNTSSRLLVERGNLDEGFARAEVMVDHTYYAPLMHQGYIEPYACVVDGTGPRVEVWASNKIPFAVKREVSEVLGRDLEDIHVHRVNIGGEFGAKANAADVPAAYYLSKATGRPVRFVNSYQEELTAATPRHAAVIRIGAGAKRDGKVVAWDARILWNSGAYAGLKPPIFGGNLGGSNNAAGWWAIPNVRIDARMVYTNQVPAAYMRAPGQPQAVFAAEMHMDLLARELGMDPLELRLKNMASRTPEGQEIVAPRVVQTAADAVGWASPKGKWIGRGVALGARGTGAGPSTSDITLNPDGTITAITAVPDNGTGGLTVVAQVVAEVWGVPIDRVQVVHGDTDSVPVDVGSGGSSITNSAGHSAIAASRQLQQQLAPMAAAMLGAESAEWDGDGWRSPDGRKVNVEEFALEMITSEQPLAHAQVTQAPERSPIQQYCAQAAEVEVDPETGEVRLRKLAAVQDVGTIINSIGHQGQVEGCVIQGVGYALMEELSVDEGRITTAHLGDYKLPTVADIPPLTTINIRTTGPGPFEAKGIGETPVVPTAAAIACAVADAIGGPVDRLPLTPERVLEAIDRVGK
jgi:CO/xanthine dehydrogenase Mo-binding subunit